MDDFEVKEKTRRAQQSRSQLATRMGRRYLPARVSLDTFEVKYREQTAVLAEVRRIIDASDFDQNLLIYGSVGTGKDHLLAALLYAAANADRSVSWVNGQEIYSRFRDAMDTNVSELAVMADFIRPEILGISDPIPPVIDPHKPAAWRTELLFRVLDSRYRDLKWTWVTTNVADPDDAAAKLSEPVWDRLRHGAVLIPCFWPSYRTAR